MDKLIVKAYANAMAGLSNTENLEEYICNHLGLPEGSLSEKYNEITEKINQEGCSNEMFQRLIYLEYMNYISELEDKYE